MMIEAYEAEKLRLGRCYLRAQALPIKLVGKSPDTRLKQLVAK